MKIEFLLSIEIFLISPMFQYQNMIPNERRYFNLCLDIIIFATFLLMMYAYIYLCIKFWEQTDPRFVDMYNRD